MDIVRHFTATGFVVFNNQIAIHWHPKVEAWLPPGGHIEANEDPVQAVLREIAEETGLTCEIIPTGAYLHFEYPTHVEPPYTIMIEDINDPVEGFHHHIDMIYFCKPIKPKVLLKNNWFWVCEQELRGNAAFQRPDGSTQPIPDDVREIGIRAIEFCRTG